MWEFLIGKIAGPIFAGTSLLLLIGVAILYGTMHTELADMTEQRDKLSALIYDPEKGFVRQTTQCVTNVGSVTGALANATKSIQALADATLEGNKRTADALAAVDARVRVVSASTSRLLAAPSTTQPGTLASCSVGEAILRGAAP